MVSPPPLPRQAGPAITRIVLLDNYAELFLGTFEGAWSLLEQGQQGASRRTLAIDARDWFDLYEVQGNPKVRVMGVEAAWFTVELRTPGILWQELREALVALRAGERVILFCRQGKHRSFQLLLYLLSPYMPSFEAAGSFAQTKRPVAECYSLPRLWLRAVPSSCGCLSKFGCASVWTPRGLFLASWRLSFVGA